MLALEPVRKFIDGPLQHTLNTYSLGAIDNREEIRVEYDKWGNVVPVTLTEDDEGRLRDYRLDQQSGNLFGAGLASAAITATWGTGMKMGLFARSGAGRMATIESLSGLQRAGRFGLMTAIAGMGAVGVGVSTYNMLLNGSSAHNQLAHANIPILSDIAINMSTPFVEPDVFDEEAAAEAALEASEIAELEADGIIFDD